jgi:hypothetical protein
VAISITAVAIRAEVAMVRPNRPATTRVVRSFSSGEPEALAHAEREAADPPVGGVGEADLASTLSTRRAGRPAAVASTRRWLRAVRPGWKPLASRTAPTTRVGAPSSR